ncbi:glycosyltransferase family 2 protein [Pedobacter metabolipauper]|uniref:Glycosyltransferase involved in cell wall biosynthesis n=1 Tax=Pedobacter metabolipauper TaxID=425513 RepID=A0A4V3D1C1_9SPHI|nr:glycosyltransferase family 2 protein [Pedobacter metabolipauper]TDQ09997.1 glycosyltransferase involved in cell wall biosynthesis [Pedobacter metabolipauper]
MLLDLTIAIPVKNEENSLKGCLDAIGPDLAKKIIVIDSGSTDRTRAIAETYGAEVVDFKWDGRYPKKRNWFLQNHAPLTKWILFLDADEHLTLDFKQELRDALTNGSDGIAGYWLKYTIFFMGKNLKGGYPLYKLALFKVGAGEYERIDEDQWSKLDMEIHEHPVLNGETGKFKNKIDHMDFRGISHYVIKHNEYASWEAKRYMTAVNDPVVRESWTWKQKIKYRLMRSVFIGPVYFFGSYILLGGFRDGKRGLSFAIMKMSYFNQVYCMIQELKINK